MMRSNLASHKHSASVGFRAYQLMVMCSVFYLYRVNLWNINISLFRIALLLTFILTVSGLFLRHIKIYRAHLFLYLFIFADLALSTLDILRSQQNSLIVREIIGHIVALGVLWVSVMQLNTEGRIIKSIKWYVFASAIAAAITIYTMMSGHMPLPEFVTNLAGTDISLTTLTAKFLGVLPRAAAGFYDPTFYGFFLCVCICFALFYRQWVVKDRVITLLMILNLIMLLLTLSRTAWIGFVVLAFVVYLYISRARLRVVILGLLLSAVVLVFALGIGAFGSVAFGKLADVGSLKSLVSREMYWNAGASEFLASPLFGGGSEQLGRAVGGTPSAHIAYLSWLAKYGILGFLIYGVFFFYPIVYGLFKKNLATRYRFLILGVMCPLAVMYFGYDLFNDLDVEYLAFGIIYAVILNKVGCQSSCAPMSVTA